MDDNYTRREAIGKLVAAFTAAYITPLGVLTTPQQPVVSQEPRVTLEDLTKQLEYQYEVLAGAYTSPLEASATPQQPVVQEPQEQQPEVTIEDLLNQLADEHGNNDGVIEDSEKRRLEAYGSNFERLFGVYDIKNEFTGIPDEIKYSELLSIMKNKAPMGVGSFYNSEDFKADFEHYWNLSVLLRIEIKYEDGKFSFEELRGFNFENVYTKKGELIKLVEG